MLHSSAKKTETCKSSLLLTTQVPRYSDPCLVLDGEFEFSQRYCPYTLRFSTGLPIFPSHSRPRKKIRIKMTMNFCSMEIRKKRGRHLDLMVVPKKRHNFRQTNCYNDGVAKHDDDDDEEEEEEEDDNNNDDDCDIS